MVLCTSYLSKIINGSMERPEEGLDHYIVLSHIPKCIIDELIDIENGYDSFQKNMAWRHIVFTLHKVFHQYAQEVEKNIRKEHGKNYSIFAIRRKVKDSLNKLKDGNLPHFQSTIMFSQLWLSNDIKPSNSRYIVNLN